MKKGDGHDPSPALFCFCVRFSGPLRRLVLRQRLRQHLFVVAAVVCLLVFLVFNFSLNDRAGAFEVRHADQQVEIPVTRDGLTDLSIDASSVRLEIGMVSSLTKPQVILSGERYSDQLAKVDLEGTSCAIELQNNKLSGDVGGLTMQVLLPQGDYNSISALIQSTYAMFSGYGTLSTFVKVTPCSSKETIGRT